METTKPLGGKLLTKTIGWLLLPAIIALALTAIRFISGIGSVTALTDMHPWGIWITLDVVIGTALGCGGYVVAFLTYALNRWQYHPLVRPALIASLLGYSFAGAAIVIDIGRYFQAVNFLLPQYWNPNSAMFEIALCVMSYILVMFIEFLPALLEKFGINNPDPNAWHQKLKANLDRIMVVFLALGILLPTMHQSSLGSLIILVGQKINPLWQTNLLPILFLLSCFSMGIAIVTFEAVLAIDGFKHRLNTKIFSRFIKILVWINLSFIILRIVSVLWNGAFAEAFLFHQKSMMFWLEMVIIIGSTWYAYTGEGSPKKLFLASIFSIVGFSLYRFNTYITAYTPMQGSQYFPSAPELLITIGLAAFEIILFIWAVKLFPVYVAHTEKTVLD